MPKQQKVRKGMFNNARVKGLGLGLTDFLGIQATPVVTVDDFHYEPEYKVLICKKHNQAVKGLDRHLKDAHGLRKRKEREPILDYYARYVLASFMKMISDE